MEAFPLRDVDELDYRVALGALGRDPLAVYVHLPFCAARCLYCGCSAIATARRDVVDHYLDRLAREIGMVAECLDERPAVTEMHWGGGTPNYLDPHELERTFTMLSTVLDLGSEAHGTECSIEADPRLVTRDQLRMLRDLGFTRLSYGVQDLDPDVQEAIGRVQPASLVFEAIEMARAAGFDKLNLDLLYGLPKQTERSFLDTLERVVAIRPSRIACFGYAHVPWMRPHQRRMDEAEMPGRDDRFALFALAVERLEDAGYQWIGFDHFALPDDPLAIAAREGRPARARCSASACRASARWTAASCSRTRTWVTGSGRSTPACCRSPARTASPTTTGTVARRFASCSATRACRSRCCRTTTAPRSTATAPSRPTASCSSGATRWR